MCVPGHIRLSREVLYQNMLKAHHSFGAPACTCPTTGIFFPIYNEMEVYEMKMAHL